jgi:hypothetical protein
MSVFRSASMRACRHEAPHDDEHERPNVGGFAGDGAGTPRHGGDRVAR